jgi:hypothetical protein
MNELKQNFNVDDNEFTGEVIFDIKEKGLMALTDDRLKELDDK